MFMNFRQVKWKPVAVPKWSCLTWNGKLSHLSCRGFAQLLWSLHLFDLLLHFFHFLPYLLFQGLKHKSVGFPWWHHQLHNAQCISSHFCKGASGCWCFTVIFLCQWHMEMFRKKIVFKRPTCCWLHRRTSINPSSPFTNNSCCTQFL